MRHRERAQKQLDEVARLHEMVRIVSGDVCVRVVQLVRLAKVCVWHHARDQGNTSPPEVRGVRATEMAVYRFVGHDCAEKHQVSPQQNVDCYEQRITDWNQKRANREETDETDDRTAEVIDVGSVLHVGSLGNS